MMQIKFAFEVKFQLIFAGKQLYQRIYTGNFSIFR